MYPLVYEPIGQSFFYDTECPVMPRYIEQLQSNRSEASRHLRHVKKTIKALSQVDLDFWHETMQSIKTTSQSNPYQTPKLFTCTL